MKTRVVIVIVLAGLFAELLAGLLVGLLLVGLGCVMKNDSGKNNEIGMDRVNESIERIVEYRTCIEKHYDAAIDYVDAFLDECPDKESEAYCEALIRKANLIMLHKERHERYAKEDRYVNTSDSDTRAALKCYKEYFELKKNNILNNYGNMSLQEREFRWQELRPFMSDCYRTEAADPAFLYDVTLFCKGLPLEFAPNGQPQLCTWEQVQQKLRPGECAVEFVQYEKHGEKNLAALVLKNEGEPRFVFVGYLDNIMHLDPDDLTKAINKVTKDFKEEYDTTLWSDNYVENVQLLLQKKGFYLRDAVSRQGGCFDELVRDYFYSDSTLFRKIWTDKLLTAISKDTQRLYFSADGIFNILAIEYMLPNVPELTSLKSANLYRLTSTRQLLVPSVPKKDGKLLLVGNIDYDAPLEESNERYANDAVAFQFKKFDHCYSTQKLKSAKYEMEGILDVYGSARTTIDTGAMATELNTVSLIKQHSIVYLSTHGSYSGIILKEDSPSSVSYNESLSKSCIVLAGKNTAMKEKDFDPTTCPDGLLSAREIAQMDFSNVDLMVLSACETGLGYVSDEGVYGLQRGLKCAGVKSMILSLWSVDDRGTTDMMTTFFKYLQAEDTHDAFMHAREDIIRSTKHSAPYYKDYNKPYYYDSFILIDVK